MGQSVFKDIRAEVIHFCKVSGTSPGVMTTWCVLMQLKRSSVCKPHSSGDGCDLVLTLWYYDLRELLIHDTHADIITIQETKLTPKAKTPKIHNFTSVRTDRLHKAGGGLITLH